MANDTKVSADKSRTLVIMVLDCSGSMTGSLEAKQREMVRAVRDQLVQAERIGNQAFQMLLFPFSVEMRPGPAISPNAIGEAQIAAVNTKFPFGSGTRLRDAIGWALNVGNQALTNKTIFGGADAVLINVITDGDDRGSIEYGPARLQKVYEDVDKTGRLTLTIAGPESAKAELVMKVGLEGNFMAWSGTDESQAAMAETHIEAIRQYTEQREAGHTKVTTFYADASKVSVGTIRAFSSALSSDRVDTHVVTEPWGGRAVADYFGVWFQKDGAKHFYEVVKPETLQDGYDIVIELKWATGQVEYRHGQRVIRELLKLPPTGNVKVQPSTERNATDCIKTVFIETKRPNRRLVTGQRLLTVRV